jgi:cytosine/adenosine deaminase-related metal-dependent hydrolase
MHTGYSGLLALAERELELVRGGHLDELANLWEDRRLLVAELPAVPPAGARECLERAADLQGRTTALLEEHLDATGAEMRRLVKGRSAMQSYAHQQRRIPLVDQAG